MELKWPWKEFPKDEISWVECKRQIEQALRKLESSLFLGTFTDVAGFKEDVLEFLEKVMEPRKPEATITIKEFKALVPIHSKDRMEPYGRFGLSIKGQKNQCENLKVGGTVFFLDTTYRGLSEDNVPEVVITQATVVDEPVELGTRPSPVEGGY